MYIHVHINSNDKNKQGVDWSGTRENDQITPLQRCDGQELSNVVGLVPGRVAHHCSLT